MYFSRFFLLFFISLFLVQFCSTELTVECLADYLKFNNVSDDTFDKTIKNSGDIQCSENIRSKVDSIHGEIQSKIESNLLQSPYSDCIMKEIRGQKEFELNKLHAIYVDKKGIGLKFWKYNSKKSKIEELENNAQEVINSAIIECKGRADYGQFFDSYYEKHKHDSSMTDEVDYCARDHLVKKQLIDPKLYGFKSNPKNLDTRNLECSLILSSTLDKLKSEVGGASNDCVLNTFYDNGYIDMILKIQLLSKMSLNQHDKENEKTKFANAMIELTRKIKSCPIKSK